MNADLFRLIKVVEFPSLAIEYHSYGTRLKARDSIKILIQVRPFIIKLLDYLTRVTDLKVFVIVLV